jgi:hypothetical protein
MSSRTYTFLQSPQGQAGMRMAEYSLAGISWDCGKLECGCPVGVVAIHFLLAEAKLEQGPRWRHH